MLAILKNNLIYTKKLYIDLIIKHINQVIAKQQKTETSSYDIFRGIIIYLNLEAVNEITKDKIKGFDGL